MDPAQLPSALSFTSSMDNKTKSLLVRWQSSVFLAVLTSAAVGNAQGTFQNLDFESANIPDLPPGQGGFVSFADGMPGWNSLDGQPGGLIGHNTVSIGGAAVAIEGPQYNPNFILFGKYTAYLVGDFQGPNSGSMWQTGQVPQTARSLYFISNPSSIPLFQVTLGSVSIPVTEMRSTSKYTVWAGDISSFAGQTEQLMFTAPPGLGGYLDQITFSPLSVPEPSTVALAALAGLALLNKSMMTNRRRLHPLNAEEKLGRAVHAPSSLSAAVAYLSC